MLILVFARIRVAKPVPLLRNTRRGEGPSSLERHVRPFLTGGNRTRQQPPAGLTRFVQVVFTPLPAAKVTPNPGLGRANPMVERCPRNRRGTRVPPQNQCDQEGGFRISSQNQNAGNQSERA